ncbi:MAG TPA: DinB family protein, partial [Longimicrobium sp.]
PATLAALLAAVPPALCARRPAPEKWSIQEVVAHLADDELVGAYRIRLILAAPGTEIQAFDQDRWAETGRYAATDPWRALALFRALREANLALWHGLSPAEWERAGVHAERGVESIRDPSFFILYRHRPAESRPGNPLRGPAQERTGLT